MDNLDDNESEKTEIILSSDSRDLLPSVAQKFQLDRLKLQFGNTKYQSQYPQLLLEFMVIEKGTPRAFCAIVGCSYSTLETWMERYPALREAREVGEAYRAWSYERLLYDCASGKIKGNFSAIKFGLMNYSGDDFKDKQEVEHTGNVVFAIDTGIKRDNEIIEAEVIEPAPAKIEHQL